MPAQRFLLNPMLTAKQGSHINIGKFTDEYNAIVNTMTVSKSDMESLGVVNGDSVRVKTEIGEAIFICEEGKAGSGDYDGFFQIIRGGLAEVSIVMNPNNPKAEISRLEYWMDNKPNPRVIEKALRDAGLSRKDATAASALLKQIIEQRDAESAKQPAQPSDSDAAVKLLEALQYRELLKAIATR